MSRFMRPLISGIHFYTAKMERTPIVIFDDRRELVGSGVIEDVTEYSVKVKNTRYPRGVFTFKYAV
ncbi:hypothetical protein [Paenibacillus urinalis]|uniref:hypothetical protein n=1 Tax=Paenibacillus urinalis TaxID=521520 RepID=UPI00362FDD95